MSASFELLAPTHMLFVTNCGTWPLAVEHSSCLSPHHAHLATTLSSCLQFRTQIQLRIRKGHTECRDSVRVRVTFSDSSVILRLLTNSRVKVCFISIDFNFINLCQG